MRNGGTAAAHGTRLGDGAYGTRRGDGDGIAVYGTGTEMKNGNVWCTGKYMYQATDITGDLIMDLHRVLTDDPGEMRFLYKLQ